MTSILTAIRRMKLQYKLLVVVGVVYLLTLFMINRGAPAVTESTSNVPKVTATSASGPEDSYRLRWKSKERIFFKKIRKGGEGEKRMDDGTSGFSELSSAENCDVKTTGPLGRPSFIGVADGIYIFSAYHDDRLPTKFVRMLGTVNSKLKKHGLNRLACMFKVPEDYENSTSYIAMGVTFYEMCENHKRLHGGWIMSCEVPDDISIKAPPTSVRVYSGQGNITDLINSKEICIQSSPKNLEKRKLNYGICVPPIYGTVKPRELIEFIELNRLLGADKFIFYMELSGETVSMDVQKVLKYYSSLHIVHLIHWQLPVRPDLIWYHGQSVAINDCLYRHMDNFKHLVFTDLDEFIIPQQNFSRWDDILQYLENKNGATLHEVSGFSFRSAYFSPEFSRRAFSSELGSIVQTNRTRQFSYRRNKVIVRPERIFELGIHHVSRSWPDSKNFTVLNVPSSAGFIHHYRTCVREFGISCKSRVLDFTVQNKYGKEISNNYLKILYDIT